MLEWIGGGQAVHPLAYLKKVRALVLLLQAGPLSPNRALRVALPAGTHNLEPVGLIGPGEDFDWARYPTSDAQRAAA